MSPVTQLAIRPVLATPREMEMIAEARRQWAEAEAAEQREQHWSGGAGHGGDVQPSSGLNEIMLEHGGEMCDRLMAEHGWSEADFRHAAGRLEAAGDPDLLVLARHMRAMEMYAAEQAERELAQMMNATESSMTKKLIDGLGEEYLREQRTPIGNQGSPGQHPRASGWMDYPTNTRPQAVDDREARGAREPAMSDRLRSLAQEVRAMSRLSSDARQRNRLLARAAELQRMSLTQYQRELENDIATSDDPEEPNNAIGRLAADLDDQARAGGAQDGDSFASFNDWSDKPGADDQIADNVADQRDNALDLGEDVPRVPRPGRRVDEDQLSRSDRGSPRGCGNVYDDDVFQRVRRGTARFGAGQPRGDDRYGHRVRAVRQGARVFYTAVSRRAGASPAEGEAAPQSAGGA